MRALLSVLLLASGSHARLEVLSPPHLRGQLLLYCDAPSGFSGDMPRDGVRRGGAGKEAFCGGACRVTRRNGTYGRSIACTRCMCSVRTTLHTYREILSYSRTVRCLRAGSRLRPRVPS